MTNTLAYLRGHRLWLVRDFAVWGSLSAYEFSFLATAADIGSKRIMFLSLPLGGELQRVNFGDLEDFRGNRLPQILANPKVIALAKGEQGVVVVGREESSSFAIARATQSAAAVLCDLVIIEVG